MKVRCFMFLSRLYLPIILFGKWMVQSPKRYWSTLILFMLTALSLKFITWVNIGGHLWGIDFYNLFTFQNCEGFNSNPYLAPPNSCGDYRGMVYPPLLYWSYIWTRFFSFNYSYAIFIITILISLVVAGIGLISEKNRAKYFFIFPFLLLQFPSAFAIQRGNNDSFVLLLWMGIIFLWSNKNYFIAGALAAVCVQFKIYPVIPVGLLGLTWLALKFKKFSTEDSTEVLASLKSFLLGFGIVSIFLFALLWNQNLFYYTAVLPKWSSYVQGRDPTVHGVRSMYPTKVFVGLFFGAILGSCWLFTSIRLIKKDPIFVLAGLLGISTFYQGVSNDYNLVTLYPMIALLFLRSLNNSYNRSLNSGLLIMGIVTSLGFKWLWGNPYVDLMGRHIVLQVVWLSAVALSPYIKNTSSELNANKT